MALIIKKLIDEKFFNIDLLNTRIKYLSYESFENNSPPKRTKEHLKSGALMFSASEMICFVQNFKFVVGVNTKNIS